MRNGVVLAVFQYHDLIDQNLDFARGQVGVYLSLRTRRNNTRDLATYSLRMPSAAANPSGVRPRIDHGLRLRPPGRANR